MDARAQLDAVFLLPCFPLWGPFENTRWALPWCSSENARMDASGTTPLSYSQKKICLLEFCSVDSVRLKLTLGFFVPVRPPSRLLDKAVAAPDLQWHDCSSGDERVQEVV